MNRFYGQFTNSIENKKENCILQEISCIQFALVPLLLYKDISKDVRKKILNL